MNMNPRMIEAINSARYFQAGEREESPAIRPWQYVLMEYARLHLAPPARIPNFASIEEAQIWMCLDSRYNFRLRERESAYRQAV